MMISTNKIHLRMEFDGPSSAVHYLIRIIDLNTMRPTAILCFTGCPAFRPDSVIWVLFLQMTPFEVSKQAEHRHRYSGCKTQTQWQCHSVSLKDRGR